MGAGDDPLGPWPFHRTTERVEPLSVPGHLGSGEQVVKPAAFERGSRFLFGREFTTLAF